SLSQRQAKVKGFPKLLRLGLAVLFLAWLVFWKVWLRQPLKLALCRLPATLKLAPSRYPETLNLAPSRLAAKLPKPALASTPLFSVLLPPLRDWLDSLAQP